MLAVQPEELEFTLQSPQDCILQWAYLSADCEATGFEDRDFELRHGPDLVKVDFDTGEKGRSSEAICIRFQNKIDVTNGL